MWKHGSPKHANWPNNTRSIFPLIFKISKNIVRCLFQTVTHTVSHWRLRILTETQSCEHIQCSKQNSVPRNIWSHICRYRIAMTKLRSNSHALEVERGRYTKPKTNICERLYPVCNVIEDDINFLANCKLYDAERTHFLSKVTAKIQNLHELNDADKFILLMSSKDKIFLVWTGKFIYKCFNIRSRFYLNYCGV